MMRRLRTDLALSLGLLTRLPVGTLLLRGAPLALAGAVWAFPLAGALAGLGGGAVYALGTAAGMPAPVCACWSLAAMLLLTGALHEDGLADMVDGFGGGRDAARKLAIMRDSRIGSFGALALLLSSLARIAAIDLLQAPARVCAGLVVSGALSRAAIVLLLVLLPPAREDGIAASLHPVPRGPALLGWAIALILNLALLRGWSRLAAPIAALIVALVLAALARRQVGGQTGDVLGGCAVITECAVLSCLSAG